MLIPRPVLNHSTAPRGRRFALFASVAAGVLALLAIAAISARSVAQDVLPKAEGKLLDRALTASEEPCTTF